MILPEPCAAHGWNHGLAAQESAFQVDAQHKVPLFFRDLHHVGNRANPGVVDEDIDAPPAGDHLGNDSLYVGALAHVGTQPKHAQPLVGQALRCLKRLRAAHVEHGHGRPGLCQPLCDCKTDATRRAGHDGYFVVKTLLYLASHR